jgi:DNA primase
MSHFDFIADVCHESLSVQHRKYMLDRGFSPATIEEFKIGTMNIQNIIGKVPMTFLKEKNMVFKNANGKYWSELNDRVIIPIYDVHGEAVALTGRVTDKSNRVKYYNSTYPKGETLFGLNVAKKEILKTNTAIVVEGNLDVIAAHQAGIKNVVAVCGTAMTNKHARLLLRYCNRIILAFDGDIPGKAAGLRSAEMLQEFVGSDLLSIFGLQLPGDEKDIDEYLNKHGAEKLQEIISNSLKVTPHYEIDTWRWETDAER